jgi:chorismate mutase/prephenate dehydratase
LGSTKPTSQEDHLESLRQSIDTIDSEILKLLNRRAEVVQEVANLKRGGEGISFYVPHRERDIIEHLSKESSGSFPQHAISAVFREIISACRSLETPLNIGYLGPPASFCHTAAIQKFGKSALFLPYDHFTDIFRAVEKGECHYGVVALRNSTEGVIATTLDNFQNSDLSIYAETHLEIHHQFLSNSKPDEIERIYSHGQAFGQSREWLARPYPKAEYVEVLSTSYGAECASKESNAAAIASELASSLYDIPILFKNIEDRTQNTTRFVVIGYDSEPPTGRDKTSLIVHIRNKPGALFTALEPFRQSGINLTHIDSRPTKNERWEYLFFVEFEGHADEAHVKKAIDLLNDSCLHTKILGSYPDEVRSGNPLPDPEIVD